MIGIETQLAGSRRGCLDGHFLLAMPGMADERFRRSVIFICAHSEDGAMGFILNKPQPMRFQELVSRIGLDSKHRKQVTKSAQTEDFPIQSGGPVDTGRGFVLHSDDYISESTMPVNDDLCLTATLDILRAIHEGRGPDKAVMMLGYAGWSAGQLEQEMAANAWLSCPAHDELVFDRDHATKYDRVLARMGVSPAMLSLETGHA